MGYWHTLGFLVFPYVALTVMIAGHLYRYFLDPLGWGAKSSELLDKDSLKYGSNLFHIGIIFSLLGHVAGLIVPEKAYELAGVSTRLHLWIAYSTGMLWAALALAGLVLLAWRRVSRPRVAATSSLVDYIVLGLLLVLVMTGAWNVFVVRYNMIPTIAPWLQHLLLLAPRPELMLDVPWTYKLHILSAFALFAVYPFSRLVHVFSAPVTYVLRRYILYRKRPAGA